jgi:hypothetical protein
MRRLILYTLGLTLALLAPSAARAQEKPAPNAAGDSRAHELLRLTRAALGGEAGFKAVKSLSATGKLRRVTPKLDQSGRFEIELSPDGLYRKVEQLELVGDVTATTETVLDGDQAWRETKTNSAIARVVKAADEGSRQARAAQLQDVRAEFSRFLLAWLLAAPSSFPAELRYGGEAEVEGERADVLDLQGPEQSSARLVIDRKTRRPLMLLYKTQARASAATEATARGTSPEEVEKAVREAQKLRQSQPPQAGESEVTLHLSDYREAGGLMLPHRLTRMVDGKTTEEWEVGKFRLDAPLRPENFRRK